MVAEIIFFGMKNRILDDEGQGIELGKELAQRA
jgi:hypothetical protein